LTSTAQQRKDPRVMCGHAFQSLHPHRQSLHFAPHLAIDNLRANADSFADFLKNKKNNKFKKGKI
jgi:hypothetical protein